MYNLSLDKDVFAEKMNVKKVTHCANIPCPPQEEFILLSECKFLLNSLKSGVNMKKSCAFSL